jgi:hypothetical protein
MRIESISRPSPTNRWARICFGALLTLSSVLAAPTASHADGNDAWPHPGYTDITAKPVQVSLEFVDAGGQLQHLDATQIPNGLLPAGFQRALANTLLTMPLGQSFDQQWTQAPDPTAPTETMGGRLRFDQSTNRRAGPQGASTYPDKYQLQPRDKWGCHRSCRRRRDEQSGTARLA